MNTCSILTPARLSWLGALGLCVAALPLSGQTVIFSESFETDGAGTRYTVENPSDDGASDYFARRQFGSPGTNVAGGARDGEWYWAAQDLDAEGQAGADLEADEGRLTWAPISVAGYGNLDITLAVAQGGDELEFDNVLLLQYRLDGGEWITAGGFRGTFTDSPARYFEGDERTFPPNTAPRLTRRFANFTWKLYSPAQQIELRVMINANGGTEQYGFDNLRVTGEPSLGRLNPTLASASLAESAGAGAFQLSLALSQPAPAGGLTVSLSDSDADNSEVTLPATLTVPAGQSAVTLNADVLNDGRFDGDEVVFLYLEAPGYARELVTFTVTNVQPRPKLIINELLPTPFGSSPQDVQGDANQDGVRHSQDDEFIELVNLENVPLDLSGWALSDNLGPRHIFPAGTILAPGRAVLVFGAGDPAGLFGGALAQIASTGNLGPSEEGDTMTVSAGSGVVASITYDGVLGATGHSIVLSQDLVEGSGYVDITTIVGESGPFHNPGLRNDGTPLQNITNTLRLELPAATAAEGATPLTASVKLLQAPSAPVTVFLTVEGANADEVLLEPTQLTLSSTDPASFTITPLVDNVRDGDRGVKIVASAESTLLDIARMLVTDVDGDLFDVAINETLSSILKSGADANGNGIIEEPVDDQFIEIVNRSAHWSNLRGFELYAYWSQSLGGEYQVHEFPWTVLAPGEAVVVFGGGNPAELAALRASKFGGAQVQVANRGGNGVNLPDLDDALIVLKTPFGAIEDSVSYLRASANQGQSLTRNPDLTGDFGALHFDVSATLELFSPGRQLDGNGFAVPAGPVPGALTYFTQASQQSADGLLFDARFGWFYAGFHPWLYSYDQAGWWYAFGDSADGSSMFLYDLTAGTWIFTSYWFHPWYYNFQANAWNWFN